MPAATTSYWNYSQLEKLGPSQRKVGPISAHPVLETAAPNSVKSSLSLWTSMQGPRYLAPHRCRTRAGRCSPAGGVLGRWGHNVSHSKAPGIILAWGFREARRRPFSQTHSGETDTQGRNHLFEFRHFAGIQ